MCWHIYLPHLFHECSLHWYLELGTPREIRIASIYHSIIRVQYLQGFKCWKRPCKYVCKMFVLVFSISSEQWLEGCHVWSPWILDPNQVNLFVILWAGHFVKHHKDLTLWSSITPLQCLIFCPSSISFANMQCPYSVSCLELKFLL